MSIGFFEATKEMTISKRCVDINGIFMIQIGGDLHNNLISNTTLSCCRNVDGECFEFNGRMNVKIRYLH